jgi:hypothetical protein
VAFFVTIFPPWWAPAGHFSSSRRIFASSRPFISDAVTPGDPGRDPGDLHSAVRQHPGDVFREDLGDLDVPLFRPGFWLVVLGQFSFIATLVTLVVSARLKKFDRSLEEAALNLGANRWR